jgi:hypothetical protein
MMSCLFTSVYCQSNTDALISKTKVVFGLGFPELLHAGFGFDLGKSNQLGLSAGFLPRDVEPVVTINAEHRLYFGKIKNATNKRQWFCRQSFSYSSDREKGGLLSFTFGKDFSRTAKRGFTADVGVQIPIPKESSDRDLYAALRIQYYIFFKKK